MNAYEELQRALRQAPQTWLITGIAGFIGSNLLETLLKLEQHVTGLDNFATGRKSNLESVKSAVTAEQWARFTLLEGDIRDMASCRVACRAVRHVLHQAALGSVPRSLENPAASHESNVTGFLNVLNAARETGVKRLVYASSSAVYGDEANLPKVEQRIGRPLSPYAATKAMNEIYADVFARCYGIETIGLRYFNVFGPRQDPDGPYAAVIPKWVAAMIAGNPIAIHGDGETSRDFCFVANVVQANLLAAAVEAAPAVNQVYNIAVGGRTTLNQLFELIRGMLLSRCSHLSDYKPEFRDFRAGDVRHSHADISKARTRLGYVPTHTIEQGLAEALDWYCQGTTACASRQAVSHQP